MSGKRIGAAVGGVLALGLVTAVTFGLALLAPVGMWIASRIMRRQNQPSTRFTSWIGAVYGVGMVIMLVGAVSLVKMTVSKKDPAVQRAMDSAVAVSRNKPPPAWLERIAPGSSARARAGPVPTGTAAKVAGVGGSIIGSVLLGTVAGMLIGSLAWAACLPLYYAIHGVPLGTNSAPEQ